MFLFFYRKYAAFAGWSAVVLIFLSAFLMQASRNGNDLWLTYWVDTSTGANNTRFYLVRVLSTMWTWTIVISMLNLVFSCSQRNIFSTFMLIQKLACADYPCYVWHHQFSFHFGKGIFFCIRWPPCSNPYSCISSWKYHQCTNLFLWPKSQWSDPKQVWYLIHQITSSLLVSFERLKRPMAFDALRTFRLSSDLYTVDDSLPFILNIFVANFFSLLGTLVVLSYSQVNYVNNSLGPALYSCTSEKKLNHISCISWMFGLQVSFLLILLPLWLIYRKLQVPISLIYFCIDA